MSIHVRGFSTTELQVFEDRLLEAGLSAHQVAKALAAIDPVAVVLTREELHRTDYETMVTAHPCCRWGCMDCTQKPLPGFRAWHTPACCKHLEDPGATCICPPTD